MCTAFSSYSFYRRGAPLRNTAPARARASMKPSARDPARKEFQNLVSLERKHRAGPTIHTPHASRTHDITGRGERERDGAAERRTHAHTRNKRGAGIRYMRVYIYIYIIYTPGAQRDKYIYISILTHQPTRKSTSSRACRRWEEEAAVRAAAPSCSSSLRSIVDDAAADDDR